MFWIVRRLLVPLAVGSAVCTVLLLIWTMWGSDTKVSIGIHDVAFFALLVLPFQAVGLVLLVPAALLLSDLSLPRRVYPTILAVVGAAIGILIMLPIGQRPHFVELMLPATCGALSALVWFAFNSDAIKRRA